MVTTHTQLRKHGLSTGQIRAQLTARRWQRVGYAIVLHNGPLSPAQRWHVARVHGGPQALLSGFAALQAQGLVGWDRGPVDVIAPMGTRLVGCPPMSVRLHRVRAWGDVRQTKTAPVHIASQALLIATRSLDQPRFACGLVAATVQQGLLSPQRILAELESATRAGTVHC